MITGSRLLFFGGVPQLNLLNVGILIITVIPFKIKVNWNMGFMDRLRQQDTNQGMLNILIPSNISSKFKIHWQIKYIFTYPVVILPVKIFFEMILMIIAKNEMIAYVNTENRRRM